MKTNKYLFSKITIYYISIAIFSFFLTLVISPWHHGGDQIVYQRVYDNIQGLNLNEAFDYYKGQIASVEIIHFTYIFVFSNLYIDKIYAMAFANSMLGFLAAKLVFRYFKISLFSLYLIITNYYILALFFTLERLKFGIILILMAILINNKIKKLLLVILSILSHLSIIILAFLSYLLNFNKNKSKLNYKFIFIVILKLIFLSILLLILYIYFEDQINQKIPAYLLVTDLNKMLLSGIKTSIYMIISCIVVGNINIKILIIYLPLITISIILEPARVNLFAYLFFLYFCIANFHKLKTKLIYYSTLVYYSFSGFFYINYLRIYGG